jgi:hypothetical protein
MMTEFKVGDKVTIDGKIVGAHTINATIVGFDDRLGIIIKLNYEKVPKLAFPHRSKKPHT